MRLRTILPLLGLLLCCAMPAGATITLNHVTAQHTTFPNTRTVTTSTGNGPYVITMVVDAGSTLAGCTDSAGNTYTLNATSGSDSGGGNVYVCYKFSATSGVTTVSFTGTGAGVGSFQFYDCSSSTGGALDTITALSSQTASSTPNPNLTAAGAGIVVAAVGFTAGNNTGGVAGPFTYDTPDLTGLVHLAEFAHDVNGAGGSLTATFTNSSSVTWASVIISFKEASVSSGGGGFGGKGGIGGKAGFGFVAKGKKCELCF